MNTDFYVYQHIRPDTGAVFYVGKGRHKRAYNFCNRGRYWDNIVKKCGKPIVNFVAKNLEEELAFFAEQECIDVLQLRGVSLVNITNGGEGTSGLTQSKETKKKIGEANKHTPKARGERHGMYGKKHSEESLAKMRKSQKGRLVGKRHPFYGKTHSEETRKKISDNRKGKGVGSNNPFFGKKHSAETREKISALQIGRKASEETRERQRRSALKSAPFQKKSRPVFCVTNSVRYYGLNEAARQLNLHRQSIRMVCNGKLKQTGGYIFEWSAS
jgi:hypothetical protein